MTQNLTLSLDKDLIQKVKVLAAQRGTSISGLLSQHLRDLVDREEAYQAAQRKALVLLDRGFALGGTIRASREEWHDR